MSIPLLPLPLLLAWLPLIRVFIPHSRHLALQLQPGPKHRYNALVYPGLALWTVAVGVGRHSRAQASCFMVAQYIAYIVRGATSSCSHAA